jgi:predicted PurR-regulated permease PerM
VQTEKYPTRWQQKTMWAALTAVFIVLLVVTAASVIWVAANVISFLQPILIPVAIAAILAYLLDPLVTKLSQRGLRRIPAIAAIFLAAFLALGLFVWWLVPTISMQSASFTKELPTYTEKARNYVVELMYRYNRTFGAPSGPRGKSGSSSGHFINWLLGSPPPRAIPSPSPGLNSPPPPSNALPPAAATPTPTELISPPSSKLSSADRQRIQSVVEKQIPNLERYLPTAAEKFWNLLKKSIGGFLGITGFLLSLVMVPIYLFFFLKERPRIETRWMDYLPLRESRLKKEVVEVLSQINSYIIAYFRGQLLVCLVDGVLIGTALTLIGLNFAPLIGLMVVILTMIPYIGIIVCWVPAVLIAAFQWGDWTHPLIVTAIFIVIQNLEGMFYAPRIIGTSVGLHPMTVIVSIFVWGLLIGGLLGPILAVPLTATLKVLLARYVWNPRVRERVMHQVDEVPVVEESESAARA